MTLDYAEIQFNNEKKDYTFVTSSGESFYANDVLFLSTENCWVSGLSSDDPEKKVKIKKKTWMRFDKGVNCKTISVIRDSVDGILEVWAEKDISRNEVQQQLTDIQTQTTNIEAHHICRKKIEGEYLVIYDGDNKIVAKYRLVIDGQGRIIEKIPVNI